MITLQCHTISHNMRLYAFEIISWVLHYIFTKFFISSLRIVGNFLMAILFCIGFAASFALLLSHSHKFSSSFFYCAAFSIYTIYTSIALFLFLCAGFLFYWANPFAIPNSLICLGAASLPPSPASSPRPRLRSGTWGVAFEPHDVVNCDSSIMSEIYWAEAVAINGTELQAKECSRAAGQQVEGVGGGCSKWGWLGGFRSVVGRARKLKAIAIENTQRVKWLKRFVGRGKGEVCSCGRGKWPIKNVSNVAREKWEGRRGGEGVVKQGRSSSSSSAGQ